MDLCKPEFLKRMTNWCKFPVRHEAATAGSTLYWKRGNSWSLGREGLRSFSLCIQADLRLTALLSQPPAGWDYRQALPYPSFNPILIDLSKVLGELLHRENDVIVLCSGTDVYNTPIRSLATDFVLTTVSTFLGVKRHIHSAWSPCHENVPLKVPEHNRWRLSVKSGDWTGLLKS